MTVRPRYERSGLDSGDVPPSWGLYVVVEATTVAVQSRVIDFGSFVALDGQRLRRGLIARYGAELGSEVCDDALEYGFRHWARIGRMENPAGYLYRAAQSRARRRIARRRPRLLPSEPTEYSDALELDVDLEKALLRLRPLQRSCVVLVHVYDWSYEEVAEMLGISHTSVRNHLHRALRKLRSLLGDEDA